MAGKKRKKSSRATESYSESIKRAIRNDKSGSAFVTLPPPTRAQMARARKFARDFLRACGGPRAKPTARTMERALYCAATARKLTKRTKRRKSRR